MFVENKDKAVYLVRVKARIPELHHELANAHGSWRRRWRIPKDYRYVSIFYCGIRRHISGRFSSWRSVWVDFVDKINFKDGVLLGAIKKASGAHQERKRALQTPEMVLALAPMQLMAQAIW